jgi:hypothetical protein
MKDFKYYSSMNLRQELIKVVAYLYHFKCRFILDNTKNDAARTIHYQIKSSSTQEGVLVVVHQGLDM